MNTIPLALTSLAIAAALFLILHYGFWSLVTLLASTMAAWCQATAEWANMQRDANRERKRLYRLYRDEAFKQTGARW